MCIWPSRAQVGQHPIYHVVAISVAQPQSALISHRGAMVPRRSFSPQRRGCQTCTTYRSYRNAPKYIVSKPSCSALAIVPSRKSLARGSAQEGRPYLALMSKHARASLLLEISSTTIVCGVWFCRASVITLFNILLQGDIAKERDIVVKKVVVHCEIQKLLNKSSPCFAVYAAVSVVRCTSRYILYTGEKIDQQQKS